MNGMIRVLTLVSLLLGSGFRAFAADTAIETSQISETAALLRQAQDGGQAARDAAMAALLANVEEYQASSSSKGLYENDLKARLKAIDSVWALGELGDPRLMPRLARFYGAADDVIRMNLLVSMGKLQNKAAALPYLLAVAADARETAVVRSVAFEMLGQLGHTEGLPGLAPSRETGIGKGDLIYTGGIVGTVSGWVSPDLPIGHSGIFAGVETKNGRMNVVIADCVPNNFKPYGGVRNVYSWSDFTHQHKFPFYGSRTPAVKPTAEQRERIVALGLEMGKKGLRYNDTHFMQKGPVEFDCVGYTEYVYEAAGLNPTPNSYETGLGWPLTPYEQFISGKPSTPARGAAERPAFSAAAAPDRAILLRGAASLAGAFGLAVPQPAEVAAEVLPSRAD